MYVFLENTHTNSVYKRKENIHMDNKKDSELKKHGTEDKRRLKESIDKELKLFYEWAKDYDL